MKYRYNGEGPVDVPELHGRVTLDAPRDEVFPLQPGDVFSTDFEINNSTFDLLSGGQPAAAKVPAPADPEPPAESEEAV